MRLKKNLVEGRDWSSGIVRWPIRRRARLRRIKRRRVCECVCGRFGGAAVVDLEADVTRALLDWSTARSATNQVSSRRKLDLERPIMAPTTTTSTNFISKLLVRPLEALIVFCSFFFSTFELPTRAEIDTNVDLQRSLSLSFRLGISIETGPRFVFQSFRGC